MPSLPSMYINIKYKCMMSHLARHGLLAERADEAVAVPVSALEGDEPANK